MIIGIDATRSRSGGAKAHLIGILNELNPVDYGISKVCIWGYSEILSLLPNEDWLIKIQPTSVDASIVRQLLWQKYQLSRELSQYGCSIVLNLDAGSIGSFQPSVTMSRDMLSYEHGEMDRYKYSKSWFRLLILKYVQISSLKKATNSVFLTMYAKNTIEKLSGKIESTSVIPHGVSADFSEVKPKFKWPNNNERSVECVYVSNIAPYKHQWVVARSMRLLREKGYDIKLNLIGGFSVNYSNYISSKIVELESDNFVTMHGQVENQKLPDMLSNFDLFIFASSCENMPNTLVEGMSTGLPIACSNRGPMPEVLKDGGVYFDPENYIDIANSIEKILTNRGLRDEISRKSKELSKLYSWKRCSNETFLNLTLTKKEYQIKI